MASDKKTILVVDDEQDIRTYLTALLTDNGYTVAEAKDGAEAWDYIQKTPPDLVLLDITMPEKSGVRLYRDIKENDAYKAIPVVMVTGVMEEFKSFIHSRRQVPPPEGYLAKPIDREEILKLVKQFAG